MRTKELEKGFDLILADQTKGSPDVDLRRAVALLGKAVLGLDRSSGRLSMVNIVLTVVILLVGFVQVIIMLPGR